MKGSVSMPGSKLNSLEPVKTACQTCSLGTMCLPMGLEIDDIERLDYIIQRNHPLHRGDYLFRIGGRLRCLFIIKTGSVITLSPREDGRERVIGFYLPGEIVGLDAIEREEHTCSAKVLETSAICEVPFRRLEELTSSVPSLQRQMYRLLSREISQDNDMLMLLGKKSAEERLAAFLLSLSCRFKKRGLSATDFYLSMSRQEVSNYLGLAVETVSRLFTRFQEEGLLLARRKHMLLLDVERMETIVAGLHTKKVH